MSTGTYFFGVSSIQQDGTQFILFGPATPTRISYSRIDHSAQPIISRFEPTLKNVSELSHVHSLLSDSIPFKLRSVLRVQARLFGNVKREGKNVKMPTNLRREDQWRYPLFNKIGLYCKRFIEVLLFFFFLVLGEDNGALSNCYPYLFLI